MGGMQVLEWGVMYPERVGALVPIATAAAASAQQIGWWSSGRRAIRMDPRWRGGDYYDAAPGDGPHEGLATARMMSMITFRSDDVFTDRFGREVVEPVDGFSLWQRFQVERYLEYQGDKLVRRFDANSYLLLTKAMDLHDLGPGPGRPGRGVRPAAGAGAVGRRRQRHPLPAVPAAGDRRRWLRPAGVDAGYAEIDSPHGHDAFLIEVDQVGARSSDPFLAPTGGPPMPDDQRHDRAPATRRAGTSRPARSGPGGVQPAARWRRCCSRRRPTRCASVDDHRRMAGTPRASALLLPLRQPDGAGLRGGGGRARGGRGGAGVRSGMAAVTGVVLGLCSTGDHVVAQRQLFSVTSALFTPTAPASAST